MSSQVFPLIIELFVIVEMWKCSWNHQWFYPSEWMITESQSWHALPLGLSGGRFYIWEVWKCNDSLSFQPSQPSRLPQTLISISAALIPSVLIPTRLHSSHHHVFCYSSESGNSVKRLKPDPDPDDKAQGGYGPFISSFYSWWTRTVGRTGLTAILYRGVHYFSLNKPALI